MIAHTGKSISTRAASMLLALAMLAAAAMAPRDASAGEQATLVKAYNESGYQLFAKLAVKPGNLVISPYSIAPPCDALAAPRTQARCESSATDALRHTSHFQGLLTVHPMAGCLVAASQFCK